MSDDNNADGAPGGSKPVPSSRGGRGTLRLSIAANLINTRAPLITIKCPITEFTCSRTADSRRRPRLKCHLCVCRNQSFEIGKCARLRKKRVFLVRDKICY